MKTLVLANQKGGVGKSAVATLLAHRFAQSGKRVLAIDFDHQGNFGSPLTLSKRAIDAGCRADELLSKGDVAVPSERFVSVAASDGLRDLERQPHNHNLFANNFRAFLNRSAAEFDVCVIDTNPNPDIRLIAALVSADFVLSPLQMNQEAVDGVRELLMHHRVGVQKIKKLYNRNLQFIGLLPTLVESTPFQTANLVQVLKVYGHLLIKLGEAPDDCALIPKRSSIAEAQASGEVLWEMKKSAARQAWRDIEPSIAKIASIVLTAGASDGPAH